MNAPLPRPPASVAELRARYKHLVWCNPEGAPDVVFQAAALRRGRFLELLDFAVVFGLDVMRAAWASLQRDEPEVAARCAAAVTRIFTHLEIGACRAQGQESPRVGHTNRDSAGVVRVASR